MKLPNRRAATVSRQKLTGYLLSSDHPVGRNKARFFRSLGFSAQGWEDLATALRQHAEANDVARTETSPFGTKHTVEGPLIAPDGRQPIVRAVWFTADGERAPHLVTAYPCEGRTDHGGA